MKRFLFLLPGFDAGFDELNDDAVGTRRLVFANDFTRRATRAGSVTL
jgi:hypothetical protein